MTLKLFKSGIHTTMGLAALLALGVASGVFDADQQSTPDQHKAGNANETDHQQTALLPEANTPNASVTETSAIVPEVQDNKANLTSNTNRPKFDVLRVEKNGSVVVAGNAVPNSQVDIVKPDGTVVGQVQTGEEGDFALALENTLTPGNHVLGLRSTDADGSKIRSVETGIVRIPESEGDVLAMVTRDGEVSRILMKPAAFEPPAKPVSRKEELSPISPTTGAEQAKPAQPLVGAKGKSTLQHPVLVEAVEVEGSQVFVAGAVMQGQLVRIYLDNVSIGTTRGTSDNRFWLSKKFELTPGTHAVRVDVINEKTGGVWSRAEVGLQHELPEKIQAHRTNKAVQFAALTRDQPTSVETAALDVNLGKPAATTDKVSKIPFNLQLRGGGTILDSGTGNPAEELQYAHTIRSAASNSSIDQDNSNFIRTGRAIIIKPGDSLWRISQLTYGDGMRYTTIFNANRNQIRDPDLIYVGQIFQIPEKAVQ